MTEVREREREGGREREREEKRERELLAAGYYLDVEARSPLCADAITAQQFQLAFVGEKTNPSFRERICSIVID